MSNYFVAVIDWFKSITGSILAWFFDLTDSNKILLFVVPLFVLGAIFVLFDYIIPLVYNFPNWNFRHKIYAMSPRNTIALKPNLHLIPRGFRRLQGFNVRSFGSRQISPVSTRDMKTISTRDMQSMSTRDMKTVSTRDMKPMSVRDMRTMSTTDMKPMSVRDMRTMSTTDMKPMSVRDMRSMSTRDMKPMSVRDMRTMSTRDIRVMSPRDMRSMSTRDMRPMSPRDMRVMTFRDGSPRFKINTGHDLTSMGRKLYINSKETSRAYSSEAEQSGTANDPRP